jgi:hypothetical protein
LEFDIVQKARHYNVHPSGIECIEIVRFMSFNLGNAFKYVFRRGDKGNLVQDLEKAQYYVNDEIMLLESLIAMVPAKDLEQYRYNTHLTRSVQRKLQKVCDAEPDRLASAVFNRLLTWNCPIVEFIDQLGNASRFLSQMIEQAKQYAKNMAALESGVELFTLNPTHKIVVPDPSSVTVTTVNPSLSQNGTPETVAPAVEATTPVFTNEQQATTIAPVFIGGASADDDI